MYIELMVMYGFMVMALIFTRVCNMNKISLIIKTALSMFLIILVMTLSSKENVIMISIMFSSVADIFLGIHRIEKKSTYLFYIALSLVTLSQICLLISSIQLAGFNIYSVILAIIMNLILYYAFKRNCKMNSMQNISMIYAYIFLLLVSNVILNVRNLNVIYIIAVILYWISDIILFIQKFISKNNKDILDGINKMMYYIAQMLFVIYI